jgi:hypothetical protein
VTALDMFPEAHRPVPTGDTPSWFTELAWFLAFEQRLLAAGLIPRPFDCDPCGHDDAPVSRLIRERAGVVYTAAQNGLWRDLSGRVVFANPPFDAETLEAWGAFLNAQAGAHGRAALLPAWTDRLWWHEHIEPGRKSGAIEVDFIQGRLYFGWPGNPAGVGGDSAKFPNCTAVWRPR